MPDLLKVIHLEKGSHPSPEEGMCLLEAAAYLAGEPHSDHPECVSTVIATFGRHWNDHLDDADRDRLLLPLLPKLIGTAGGDEKRLSLLALDWLLRVYTPAWLDLAEPEHAEKLREMPEVTEKNAHTFAPVCREARSAAWSAAESAARSAALGAAVSAAVSAAWSAAWSAALSAACSAAVSAAWSAAESAALSAAESAGAESLAPTVVKLQASAVELLEKMVEEAKR